MSLAHQFLRSCLSARLSIIESRRARFAPGWDQTYERINASRLIVMCSGKLPYEVNGASHVLRPGEAILVPLAAYRRWVIPDDEPCGLAWFRFHAQPTELSIGTALIAKIHDLSGEIAAIDRMIESRSDTVSDLLRQEAEAKGVLGRTLADAKPLAEVPSAKRRRGDRSVALVATHLNQHFAKPDALAEAMERTDLSLSHFRRIFREQVGLSPQAFLTRRRMQSARTMLRNDLTSIKQVAAAVGYLDPLHFSKQYHRFWGHPPSQDHLRRWSPES
ncbi:MAG: AraC family transcriptional regulator [Planctomycetota bacterium]